MHHFTTPRFGKSWNSRWAGKEAFTHTSKLGYKSGGLLGKLWGAHRVIYKMITGHEPEQIDHINGDRTDNRFENLRSVSAAVNMKNQKQRSNNTSGTIGVHWHSVANKWCAAITVNLERIALGRFCVLEDAIEARKAAEIKYGFHENHGIEVT